MAESQTENAADNPKCSCGAESDVGCHGFRHGEIYDEYHCYECWAKKKRNGL